MTQILTQNQRALLEAVGRDKEMAKRFYLTGDTPLAVFYLHHRYSEDLDFFSEQEVDSSAIAVFLETQRKPLGITDIDFQQSFNRNLFFLRFGKETLKTEFTYFPFPRIERGETRYGIVLDSVFDIAVNKLFTIYQRTKARDYIDLFMLCRDRGFAIRDLVAKAKQKFDWHVDPIQLGAQFLRAEEAVDYPRMSVDISPKEWQDFFVTEAKKLRGAILE